MRISDVPKSVPARLDVDAKALSSSEVRSLFTGVDLGWFPKASDVCTLLGRAANALAALFDDEPAPDKTSAGGSKSIVDFGDRPASIVDFGAARSGKGGKSIVDFGDRPASIVDFGDQADDVAD